MFIGEWHDASCVILLHTMHLGSDTICIGIDLFYHPLLWQTLFLSRRSHNRVEREVKRFFGNVRVCNKRTVFYDKLKNEYTMEELSQRLLVHEYGHTIQSLVLGPLYLIIIGIPSTLWGFLPHYHTKRRTKGISYFSFFTEAWANSLGERVTGQKSMENLMIDWQLPSIKRDGKLRRASTLGAFPPPLGLWGGGGPPTALFKQNG